MKILVCLKQVPDMESRFAPSGDGVWYDESDLAFRMNDYDEYAVEQAVALKESKGGEPDVTALSIGPDRVKEAIKKALAMGADRGVHIKDDEYYKRDPNQIASMIAEFARDKEFDVVFTGLQSQDRGSAQVGALLAEKLGYACVTAIVGFEMADGAATVRREFEGGLKAVVKVDAPAVFTCQLGLNTPRYPTLPNIMKAKKKELATIESGDVLKTDSTLATESMFVPEKKGAGLVLEGDAGDIAEKVVAILKEKTGVLK